MRSRDWRSKAPLIAMINCIQFLIFTNMAMLFYPGGTFLNSNTVGYSIWENLFSDLGRYISHSGELNLISCIMYNISLFLMGLLFIPFFLALPQLFNEKEGGKGFSKAGSVCGLIVSISMIGASLTPADLLYGIHVSFGLFKFITLLPLVIFYTFAILQNPKFSNRYSYVYIVFGIMQFIFIYIMFTSASDFEISTEFATGQNVVIWAMSICFLIESYGAFKLFGDKLKKLK